MKYLTIILFFCIISCKSARLPFSDAPDDRLYLHVDSLITQVLNYEYNEDSLPPEVPASQLKNYSPGPPKIYVRGGVPKNPEPLIVVNGVLITKEALKAFYMNDVKDIRIMNKAEAPPIYGARAVNGVILITISKKRSKASVYRNPEN